MHKQLGMKRLVWAWLNSINGLKSAVSFEVAFRQELLMFSLLAVSSFFFSVTPIEHVLMLASLGLVLIVELFNSAIECLSDRITTEFDPLIKRAKDYGSLAVLMSLFIAAAIWLVILITK